MSVLLGLALGAGLLLSVAPLLWKVDPGEPRRTSALGRFARERLAQAGLDQVSPALVIAVSVVLGLAASAAALAMLRVVALALVTFAVVALVPSLAVGQRARARRRAMRVSWPDVVDQLISAVRSGRAVPDALCTLAHSGPVLTRSAFGQFEADYRATGAFSPCVDLLKDKLADPVADRILETLRMSREVGGTELTTVLRNLGAYLRQESAIRSEVEARQSWVLNAARLGVAAPWVVLLLLATRPEAAAAYNSLAGTVLITGGIVVTVAAYRAMIVIGRLPDERRWFA